MFSFLTDLFSSSPKEHYGSMFIRLDKGSYVPGERMVGSILIELVKPCPAPQLWLTIIGLEETRLISTSSGRRNSRRYHTHDDENKFLHQRIALATFPSNPVPPGQYQFPFGYFLSSSLPGSFRHEFSMHSRDCYARIQYEVMASLENGDAKFPAVRHQLPVVIDQPNNLGLGGGNSKKELSQTIMHCCCFDRGQSRIVSYFEKNDYFPGEVAYLITEADNSQGKAAIKSIKASLKQVLHLRAGSETHTISKDLNTMVIPGVAAGMQKVGQNAERLAIKVEKSGGASERFEPTARGKLICNEYFLVNSLEMDATLCCSEEPQCCVQVAIKSLPANYAPWNQQPPNWLPQQMPVDQHPGIHDQVFPGLQPDLFRQGQPQFAKTNYPEANN